MTEKVKLDKGTFLIASPEIEPGLFFRSVILICEHSQEGSFGLVINKPLHVNLPDDLISPEELESSKVQTRAGGPIQPNQMMLLHSSDKIKNQTLKVIDGVYLGGDVDFLQDSLVCESPPDILLCFGYAGWGPGVLEREFLNGLWIAKGADKKYIFNLPPESMWKQVLRDMGGKYSNLSMIPEDLNLN